MRPYVICHMGSTVDGRILPARWSFMPDGTFAVLGDEYEATHDLLGGEAWLVGRITMSDFAKGEPKPGLPTTAIDRGNYVASRNVKGYAIGIDAKGKLHYGTNTANGNHIVTVLSEGVTDEYLAELRQSGISYIIAGKAKADLPLALDMLARDFGIKRLLLEGGGAINGAFLKAKLVDELSLLVAPAVDGLRGSAAVFDFDGDPSDPPENVALTLQSVEQRPHQVVWLRYKLEYLPG